MILKKIPLSEEQLPFPSTALLPEHAVFFDIETTGLSHRTSHLYLIGAICKAEGQWLLLQWFLQKPSEEKEVLEAFSALLKNYDTVIHYNGQTFDIPYISNRCAHWELEDPFSGDAAPASVDLFRQIRPFKNCLGLDGLKQKDIENYLHFPRQDEKDGGELIRVYRHYLRTADSDELALLLLHNHDDLMGMLTIYAWLQYLGSLPESCRLTGYRLQGEELTLLLEDQNHRAGLCLPEFPLLDHCTMPCDAGGSCRLKLTADGLQIHLEGIRGSFRHYYSNYKDYFYLPLEDTAIHKSVGIYVDPSCREKAKADTCYTRKEGLYFFQPEVCIEPEFRMDRRKGPSWFCADQLEEAESGVLHRYAEALIRFILKN